MVIVCVLKYNEYNVRGLADLYTISNKDVQ